MKVQIIIHNRHFTSNMFLPSHVAHILYIKNPIGTIEYVEPVIPTYVVTTDRLVKNLEDRDILSDSHLF